jgi:hypothetical protein
LKRLRFGDGWNDFDDFDFDDDDDGRKELLNYDPGCGRLAIYRAMTGDKGIFSQRVWTCDPGMIT